jgi:peptidoglycan L-alanyl-D-glutamate endopeptidase CwlK
MYKLGPRSIARLRGVHEDLVKVVERAIEITTVDFTVLEAGASQTLNSRHITGHAVDLGAWIDEEVRWDWPLYHKIAAAMKEAAKELDVAIVWGGDWRTFKDGPHFELDRRKYP